MCLLNAGLTLAIVFSSMMHRHSMKPGCKACLLGRRLPVFRIASSLCRPHLPKRTATPSHRSRLRRECTSLCRAEQAAPAPLIDGGFCMEDVLEQHARRILAAAADLPEGRRYIVLIAGAPGSGKTTSAELICRILNEAAGTDSPEVAVVASMDGFHYYRSQLDAMPDPEEAHARRGAHWTFDAPAFVAAVESLSRQGDASWPSFDHAVGDPVPDDVSVSRQHRIVLIEGNYVLLEEEPWGRLRTLADEAWFIDCGLDEAMDRVIARQVGNGSDRATAEWRVANNDRPNAELIAGTKHRACHVIPSLPLRGTSPD